MSLSLKWSLQSCHDGGVLLSQKQRDELQTCKASGELQQAALFSQDFRGWKSRAPSTARQHGPRVWDAHAFVCTLHFLLWGKETGLLSSPPAPLGIGSELRGPSAHQEPAGEISAYRGMLGHRSGRKPSKDRMPVMNDEESSPTCSQACSQRVPAVPERLASNFKTTEVPRILGLRCVTAS